MKDLLSLLVAGFIIIGLPAAWITHLIFCFSTSAWGFLIAGAIFFPIGMLHGIYLWFV